MRKGKQPVLLTWRDIAALIEATLRAESVKPSQQAKRDAFRKYGVLGTRKDPPLTAIFYRVMLREGVIDRVIKDITGVVNPALLDPHLRAALRVFIELKLFSKGGVRFSNPLEVKNRVAAYISSKAHPFAGTWFWDAVDRLEGYRLEPKSKDEELMFKYLLPPWYIKRMLQLIGSEAEELFKALLRKPLICVRVNILKSSVGEVAEELRREGKDVKVSEVVPTVIKFKGPYNFDRSRLFGDGKIVIQEEAAALASLILNPKPGETVVDLCAAPGGKTEHMAELMRNKGVIYAFDIDKFRVRRMEELLGRAGISIVKIFVEDGRKAPKLIGSSVADKVLVDAPCTSDGTLMKNPDLRWRMHEDEVPKFAQIQYELLKAALKLVKPGGRVLYTTCSLLREECEDVIVRLLSKERGRIRIVGINGPYDPGFVEGVMRAWPHRHETIGFFYALIEKVPRG